MSRLRTRRLGGRLVAVAAVVAVCGASATPSQAAGAPPRRNPSVLFSRAVSATAVLASIETALPEGGPAQNAQSTTGVAAPAAGPASTSPSAGTSPSSSVKPLIAPAWAIQETPSLAGGAILYGVSCTSPTACTTVGENEEATLAERWNGSEWATQATPASGALHAVSCSSETACTAVGAEGTSSGEHAVIASATLAEAWNGSAWAVQPTPNPPGATHDHLEAVSCTAPSECTATGWYEQGNGQRFTLAERWDGSAWTIQPTPSPGEGEATSLTGVSCTSPSSCTASGFYYQPGHTGQIIPLIAQWDGSAWTLTAVAQPSANGEAILLSLSCTSSPACTTVGRFANPGYTPLAERSSATEWAIQPVPDPEGESILHGVSCASPTACEAVGVTYATGEELLTLAESWNGATWELQSTPNPAEAQESILYSTSCPTTTVCVAVGYSHHAFYEAGVVQPPTQPLIERFE